MNYPLILKVLISAAYKVPFSEDYKTNSFSISPYASFIGRVSEAVEQNENDCKFGTNLSEYNNFSFANREKMNFNIQVVYEAGPDSRFRKLASKLVIGKLVFISGFFDLNENELPFIEAKEIDLIDDLANNPLQNQFNISYRSPFSRTHKFRNNKNMTQSPIGEVKNSDSNEVKIINDGNNQADDVIIKTENESSTSTSKANNQLISQKANKNPKRKKESGLLVQRSNKVIKHTNVKTRSQKQKEDESNRDNSDSTEEDESI
jgi:hypothetical protein